MRKIEFFIFISCLLTTATTWAREGALLTGTITGTKKETLTLLVRPPFSVHSANGLENYIVPVDNSGNFSFQCRYKKADIVLYESDSESPYIVLYMNDAHVHVQWTAGAILQSFKITQDPDSMNRVSVAFQQMFQPRYDSLLNSREEEPDFGKMVRAVNELNEKGFDFLKRQRPRLDSQAYHQLAYDFYFRNLELIVTARNYSPLFKDSVTGRFPFIVCYDHKYEQNVANLKNSITVISSDIQRAGYLDSIKNEHVQMAARPSYFVNFVITDANALCLSYGYRSFLHYYVTELQEPLVGYPYPQVDSRTILAFDNFSLWIRAVIHQQKIIDWFLASKWITDASGNRQFADTASFKKLYNQLADHEIKQWLKERFTAISEIGPGIPAPAFMLYDETNKPVCLSKYSGKPVFITFWSTSCRPCIEEIKMYNKRETERFKENVVFINIALDENKKLWKEALKKYDIRGVNLIAGHGWADSVAIRYKISAIPCNILIDKNGVISSYNTIKLSDLEYSKDFLKMIGQ